MAHNEYWAYGLRIQADLECPQLPSLSSAVKTGNPDVVIRLLPSGRNDRQALKNDYYEVRPTVFLLKVPKVASYRVEEGRRILITPFPNVSAEEFRLFLLGSSMGALLYQRGLFPLHGSAVETPWGAMIFVGPEGAGKSTLAAYFHQQGYRLLSDDICAIQATPKGFMVLPALDHIRLCADAYERFQSPSNAQFNVDKYVVPMGRGYCPHPAPLQAIHILANHDGRVPKFEVLHGFDRVQHLFENLYRPHYLKGQSTQNDLMRMAGVIAQKTAIATVTRRRDAEAIPSLINFLESEWEKRFSVVPPAKEN